MWDPASHPESTSNPFKTLFVSRINYDTSESKLRREFENYGAVKKVTIIQDKEAGKHRGYAFVEYEHERDMHAAYKHADGKKIDGRRVLVDVERGRTVKGWLPRRLGGGLGGTRRGGPEQNAKHSGREDSRTEDRERGDRYEASGRGRDRDRSADDRPRRRSKSRDRERRDRKKDRSRSPAIKRERSDRDRGDRPEKDRADRPERERAERPEKERGERTEKLEKPEREQRRRERVPSIGDYV